MNTIQKILAFLWQWFVALPILIVATLLCAIFTILLVHWKDSAFVHGFQQLWSRLFFWMFFIVKLMLLLLITTDSIHENR